MSKTYGTLEGGRELLLTFDDGPHPTLTPRLLDCLKEHQAKAVFFVIGQRVAAKGGKETVRRVFEAGHTIGNHTFTHPDLRKLSAEQIRDELKRTEDLIAEFMTEHKLFRPPFGAHNPTVDTIVREMGYHMVLWNVDSEDWRKRSDAWIAPSVEVIRNRGTSTFLSHDIHPTTVKNFSAFLSKIAAVPKIRFVTYA